MKSPSKIITTSAATLLGFAVAELTTPAVQADEYCITSGAQAAHGCGYPSMETCRAASSGIGGICSPAPSYNNPSNALAYQPKRPHSRSKLRPVNGPVE